MASEQVSTDVVLVQEFPDLARAYAVSSVPLTVVEPVRDGIPATGQGVSVLGARPAEDFVDAVVSVGGDSRPGSGDDAG